MKDVFQFWLKIYFIKAYKVISVNIIIFNKQSTQIYFVCGYWCLSTIFHNWIQF
jgi:hypothetical protein